jgi:hypothetical protein
MDTIQTDEKPERASDREANAHEFAATNAANRARAGRVPAKTVLRIDAARTGAIDDRAYALCRLTAARRARDSRAAI